MAQAKRKYSLPNHFYIARNTLAAAGESRNVLPKERRTPTRLHDPLYRGGRIRLGKTARDRANGNAQRARERKLLRAAWQQDPRANPDNFPV